MALWSNQFWKDPYDTSSSIWSHHKDNSWKIWSAFTTWCGSSGGQIIIRLQRLSRRALKMSLKSLTSSRETHEVTHHKSVSFISSFKLVNLHTAHNKDQQGRVEKSIPLISLHRGTCTALFMSGAGNKWHWLARSHVTCVNDIRIYGYGSSWGDQRETTTCGAKDNINGGRGLIFKLFFVGPLQDNEWEHGKSQRVNGDIWLDEEMPTEAGTIEWASEWTLTAW